MAFDEEQTAALQKMIAEGVASSLPSLFKSDDFKSLIGEAAKAHAPDLSSVTDTIAALQKQVEEGGTVKGKESETGATDLDAAVKAALAKQRQEFDARFKEIQAEKDKAEAARRDALMGTQAREALRSAGITKALDPAFYALKGAGLLDFTEEGEPGIWGNTSYGTRKVLPLADGLAEWVKGDGQHFVDPRDTGGHGKGGGGGTGGGGAAIKTEEQLAKVLGF